MVVREKFLKIRYMQANKKLYISILRYIPWVVIFYFMLALTQQASAYCLGMADFLITPIPPTSVDLGIQVKEAVAGHSPCKATH